jgi:dTDP-4-dehydrorhamnose reductase
LVTGGTGQVGIELLRRAPGQWEVVAPNRVALDLIDGAAIAALVASRPWAAVINCAAYTAVDRAESDVEAAWRLNALAPAILAAETARFDIPMVHVSTDYVFDGTKGAPYQPADPVAPLGVYGASKLGGELAVRSANPRHVILRTAWVVSAHRANFVKTMLRLGAERPKLRVVDDQLGCPTSAADIADALYMIVGRLIGGGPAGTYHFVNRGEATWCALAREIFVQAAARGHAVPEVDAIATADYPTPARRPANSRLNIASLERDFGVHARPWQAALIDIIDELVEVRTQRSGERS